MAAPVARPLSLLTPIEVDLLRMTQEPGRTLSLSAAPGVVREQIRGLVVKRVVRLEERFLPDESRAYEVVVLTDYGQQLLKEIKQ